MRDLPLPERDSKPKQLTQQTVKLRGTESLSLTEWGEKSDFWSEWKDEFQEASPVEANAVAPAPKDFQKHEGDSDIFLEPWASQLALHERRLEKEGTVDYGVPFRRQELLKDKTKEFANVLQAAFRRHIEQFNLSRKSAAHSIHIYKISRSDEDFLIYRNGVKLLVSAQQAGRITLSFNQYIAPLAQAEKHGHVELEGVWGPFDQLYWTYRGERVQLMDIVRFFVSELAFQSFR